MDEKTRIIDYRQTEVGMQNWEVCIRMLMHDLVDMGHVPEIKALLDFYSVSILPNGAHTMALPRKWLLDQKKKFEEEKRLMLKPGKKVKNKTK